MASLGWEPGDHIRLKLTRKDATTNLVGDYGITAFGISTPS